MDKGEEGIENGAIFMNVICVSSLTLRANILVSGNEKTGSLSRLIYYTFFGNVSLSLATRTSDGVNGLWQSTDLKLETF